MEARVVFLPLKWKEEEPSNGCAMKFEIVTGAKGLCCDGLEIS